VWARGLEEEDEHPPALSCGAWSTLPFTFILSSGFQQEIYVCPSITVVGGENVAECTTRWCVLVGGTRDCGIDADAVETGRHQSSHESSVRRTPGNFLSCVLKQQLDWRPYLCCTIPSTCGPT